MRILVGVSVLGAVVWGFALIGMATVAATIVAPDEPAATTGQLLESRSEQPVAATIVGLDQYPGSVQTSYRHDALGDLTFTNIAYSTTDPISSVRAFYDAAVADNEWTTSDATFTRGEWMYAVQSGGRRGVVMIHPGRHATVITIEMSEPAGSRGDASQR